MCKLAIKKKQNIKKINKKSESCYCFYTTKKKEDLRFKNKTYFQKICEKK